MRDQQDDERDDGQPRYGVAVAEHAGAERRNRSQPGRQRDDRSGLDFVEAIALDSVQRVEIETLVADVGADDDRCLDPYGRDPQRAQDVRRDRFLAAIPAARRVVVAASVGYDEPGDLKSHLVRIEEQLHLYCELSRSPIKE